jgi:hypothetical protein
LFPTPTAPSRVVPLPGGDRSGRGHPGTPVIVPGPTVDAWMFPNSTPDEIIER